MPEIPSIQPEKKTPTIEEKTVSTAEKVNFAKKLFGTDKLPKHIEKAIKKNNIDLLFPDDRDTENEAEEKKRFQLLDTEVIGNRKITQPKQIIPYEADKRPDIIGFNTELRKTHPEAYFGQERYAETTDTPLVSTGFSFCHAVIIHDRDSCHSYGCHIMENSLNSRQIVFLENKLKNSKNCEAIIIHGSDSRESDDHHALKKLGVKIGQTINTATGPYHWDCQYDPQTNEVMVKRNGDRKVFVYAGFSPNAYDKEHFDSFRKEERQEELERQAVLWISLNHRRTNKGFFSQEEFDDCIEQTNTVLGSKLTSKDLLKRLIKNQEAFIHSEKIVIPSAMNYENNNKKSTDLYEKCFDREKYSFRENVRILELGKTQKAYQKLMCTLSDFFVLGNLGILQIKDKEGNVVLINVSNDSVEMSSQNDNQLFDHVRETLKNIITDIAAPYKFTAGQYSTDNEIPPKEIIIKRKRMYELLEKDDLNNADKQEFEQLQKELKKLSQKK